MINYITKELHLNVSKEQQLNNTLFMIVPKLYCNYILKKTVCNKIPVL